MKGYAVLKGIISRGIKDINLNENGHLVFTMSDNDTIDIGKVIGEDGEDGVGIAQIEQVLTNTGSGKQNVWLVRLTDERAFPIVLYNGEKGEPGAPGPAGAPGATPQRGIDYFTDQDIKAMVADILAALPKYNGEVASV